MLPDATYHLYNHANGNENLFKHSENYEFFLGRIRKYVQPVSYVYSYCLMPNHFHLLLKIRERQELERAFRKFEEERHFRNSGILVTRPLHYFSDEELNQKISNCFSNAFNSYTQTFNKAYGRRGSLFRPNMKSKEVIADDSFCQVARYIHNNPIHHRFEKSLSSWPFSSYNLLLGESDTWLDRDYVLNIFGGKEKFVEYHRNDLTLGGYDPPRV